MAKAQTFHESPADEAQPLDDVDVLIAGGTGQGLKGRLARKGIIGLTTVEKDPETAVQLYLDGLLVDEPRQHRYESKLP